MKGFIEVTITHIMPSKKRLDEGVKPSICGESQVLIPLISIFDVFNEGSCASIGIAVPDGDYVGWKTKETYEEVKQKMKILKAKKLPTKKDFTHKERCRKCGSKLLVEYEA